MREALSRLCRPMRRAAPLALLCVASASAAGSPAAAGADPAAPQEKVDPHAARMPKLPPAVLDDTLAIGGSGIDARKLATRMTVAVRINGAGPYRFVVDSGADTSVVGGRIAARLGLPAGRRTILNAITDSQYVDQVLVDELEVGRPQSATSKCRSCVKPILVRRVCWGWIRSPNSA